MPICLDLVGRLVSFFSNGRTSLSKNWSSLTRLGEWDLKQSVNNEYRKIVAKKFWRLSVSSRSECMDNVAFFWLDRRWWLLPGLKMMAFTRVDITIWSREKKICDCEKFVLGSYLFTNFFLKCFLFRHSYAYILFCVEQETPAKQVQYTIIELFLRIFIVKK